MGFGGMRVNRIQKYCMNFSKNKFFQKKNKKTKAKPRLKELRLRGCGTSEMVSDFICLRRKFPNSRKATNNSVEFGRPHRYTAGFLDAHLRDAS